MQPYFVLLTMRLFCMLTRLGRITKLARVKNDTMILVSGIEASAKSMLPISALLFLCNYAMSAKCVCVCVWVCSGQPCPPLAESNRGERVCVRVCAISPVLRLRSCTGVSVSVFVPAKSSRTTSSEV